MSSWPSLIGVSLSESHIDDKSGTQGSAQEFLSGGLKLICCVLY